MSLPYFVHASAVVDEDVSIGDGTKVWHFTHVQARARIGARCVLGQNVLVGPGVVLGEGVHVQNNVSVYAGVTLEDFVFVGPSAVFTNVRTPRCEFPRKDALVETRVRRGASLGANCTIVCGTTIGRYAMIGAGAVVTRDVPDHALVLGNPARAAGWVCTCGLRLDTTTGTPCDGAVAPGDTSTTAFAACGACGRRFARGAAGLSEIA